MGGLERAIRRAAAREEQDMRAHMKARKCPWCGGKLKKKLLCRVYRCTKCEREFYW